MVPNIRSQCTQLLPQHCEDVSGTGRILASLQPGSKLTNGLEQIDVVGAHIVLGQVDDGGHERGLTVVICGVFSH